MFFKNSRFDLQTICYKIVFLWFIFFGVSPVQLQTQENSYKPETKDYVTSWLYKNFICGNDVNFYPSLKNFYNPVNSFKQIDSRIMIDSLISISTLGGKGRYTYEYNEKGWITSFLIELYIYGYWKNTWRITQTYNPTGNLLTYLDESWNGSEWENSSRQTYSYNSQQNIVQNVVELWQNGNWKYFVKTMYSYDSTGLIVTSITHDWKENEWINNIRMTKVLFDSGKMDSFLIELWNGSDWEKVLLVIYEYDEDWNLITAMAASWDGNNWKYYLKLTNTNNSEGYTISRLIEIWENNEWITSERTFYERNTDNYITHAWFEIMEDGTWIPEDGAVTIENPDGFYQGFLTYEVFGYYSKVTGINEEKDFNPDNYELFPNYPNPFNPTTKIKFTIPSVETAHELSLQQQFVTLIVYDILGRKIATLVNEPKQPGNYEIEFDAGNLPSGVYFYRLSIGSFGHAGDFISVKKMILIR